MTKKIRKDRKVEARHKALQPVPPQKNLTMSGIRPGAEGLGGEPYACTITGHCRTQIFEFPGIDFHPDGDEPHHQIYKSTSVQAYLTTNLVGYFINSTSSTHFAISPSLRHCVGELEEKIRSQQQRIPVFLVVEEFNQLTPVEMLNGECSISDEVAVRDCEKHPVLVGGREGKKFITAWDTTDGAWPAIPNNQPIVNLILAGVRVGQQTDDPIKRYLNQECLVTDLGEFVTIVRFTASARGSVLKPMDSKAYRKRVDEICGVIASMEQDMSKPHLALLINAMYRDDFKDDDYQRLHYLQLWQSLQDAGRKVLGYKGNLREDDQVIAGSKSLLEITEYRDDIAHGWTTIIDENFLVNLQRTINELVRRKYL